MKQGCHNVKGIVMVSPVDGVDPYGIVSVVIIVVKNEMVPKDLTFLIRLRNIASPQEKNLTLRLLPWSLVVDWMVFRAFQTQEDWVSEIGIP